MKNKTPIAVVGIAGIFPGASDIDAFWHNISNKTDSCREIPADRWSVPPDFMFSEKPAPDKTYSRKACLVNDFKFDPAGIDIDKSILQDIDPLYQFVLHAGREAFSDCVTRSLDRKRTGVALAAIALPTDASSLLAKKIIGRSYRAKFDGSRIVSGIKPLSQEAALSACVTSLPASILAKGLGLSGGSFTLDAACASSIYAVKLACDELTSYRADAMLAGGVSRPDCLYTQVGFSQLRALSPSGRCAPFDEKADGLVVGEGAGILVLKRLEDAVRSKDKVYGIIRGIGLSNDIGGNLLSPDSEGQVRAMKMAYEAAGWNPWDVDLIECHGTGTPAGDATEIASLVELWGKSGWSKNQCAIGSVKSMIGHLLTGAGAAGMIKALLAMKNNILPPSLHFNRAPAKSPIHGSPFRVQPETEKWEKREKNIPLRAAISAFGFGGINGHLLFEEWLPDIHSKGISPAPSKAIKNPEQITAGETGVPVAIIGMDAFFGKFKSLAEFRKAIFNGNTSIGKRPEGRWKGCDETAGSYLGGTDLSGAFIKDIELDPGDFHIPPVEIPDILLQHLLILKVASGAMKDAQLPAREKRPRMGVIIGADFDYGATDFQLRWDLFDTQKENPGLNIELTRDACSPPLTSARTLGALGGIIASRIAREFRFGGPGFVISCDSASGLKALEAGVRSVQENATDMMLIGAVDLAGDLRNIIIANGFQTYAKGDRISSFDVSSSGTLPGEGAGAVIIKRLDKAIDDNDRIYAVIKGIGKAGAGGQKNDISLKETYSLSFERALNDASVNPSDISYYEAHGSGNTVEDGIEIGVIDKYYKNSPSRCAVGSVKPNIGHTGSASGIASLIKAVLCLYHETIQTLLNFTEPNSGIENKLHFPAFTQFWYRDRIDGPRRACTASITRDGNCMHVLTEAYEYEDTAKTPAKVLTERKMPLVSGKSGLFIIEGNSEKELLEKLDLLSGSVDDGSSLHECALKWFKGNKPDPSKKYALSIAAGDTGQLRKWIGDAKIVLEANTGKKMNGPGGICYSPKPLGNSKKIAFIFPGSGNHYIGMGRGIGIYFPEILRKMDRKTNRLKTQLVPECFVPWRNSWQKGWENDAREKIAANPLNMIFGQVIYGGIISALVTGFGVKPSAVIGYSLGESAGNFAMNLWPDHEEMLKRMTETDLFTTELAGPCNSARLAWNIPPGEDLDWRAAAVNRPAGTVRKSLAGFSFARLLIVNTPDECVIGGRKKDVEAVISKLKCEAVFLEGVVTVHCDAVNPVAEKYKNLHLFPVTPPAGISFYSCALGRSFEVTCESAADSILKQATGGFDFAATIEQAYKDGISIFLEMGPHSSCTRMIDRILGKRPHLAVSASFRGEDEYFSLIKFLGALASERIPADFGMLYSDSQHETKGRIEPAGRKITLSTCSTVPSPVP
ncbi:MAG: hypothetical protein QG578_2034, partial [Thermodesulfobacteriota bacterium]|nr:hypothetical protein [Thermodesulfobacteriota bacterium]